MSPYRMPVIEPEWRQAPVIEPEWKVRAPVIEPERKVLGFGRYLSADLGSSGPALEVLW